MAGIFFFYSENKIKTDKKPRHKKNYKLPDCWTTYSDSDLVMMLQEDYITLTLYGRFSYFTVEVFSIYLEGMVVG